MPDRSGRRVAGEPAPPRQPEAKTKADIWVAGVDGCKAGWVAIVRKINEPSAVTLGVFSRFEDLLNHPMMLAKIAVDMPIGLPQRTGPNGRAPERAIRPLLGARQSSVFSMPSRAAIYAPTYQEACRLALETSDPPRKVAKQGYYLFGKVREIDQLMTPALGTRVFEVHPELAFWRLNGACEMQKPKKIKGKANPVGLAERRELLLSFGYEKSFLDQPRPRGVGADDVLDAAANALIAERLWQGIAQPFPARPQRDENGILIAIWV